MPSTCSRVIPEDSSPAETPRPSIQGTTALAALCARVARAAAVIPTHDDLSRRGSVASASTVRQELAYRGEVVIHDSSEASPWGGVKIGGSDYHQRDAVCRDDLVATGVVSSPLDPAVNSAHRDAIGLVEMRDRTVVLQLPVLHHDVRRGPIAIDWEPDAPPTLARVTEQPLKAILALADLTQGLVAQV